MISLGKEGIVRLLCSDFEDSEYNYDLQISSGEASFCGQISRDFKNTKFPKCRAGGWWVKNNLQNLGTTAPRSEVGEGKFSIDL